MSTSSAADGPAMTGSCQCGKVTFSSTSPAKNVGDCFCKDCRKLHGAVFATFADIPDEDLTFSGERTSLFLSPTAERTFCASCRSPLTMKYTAGKHTGIVVGCIDTSRVPVPKAQYHVYVKDKPDWYEITDDAPQYQEFSPGFKERLGL